MHVTVYTITYNQCEIVERTVRGLFEQNYPKSKYEIIVLDDGSTDNTPKMLAGLVQQSPVPMKVLSCSHEGDYLSARRWNQCIASSSPQSQVFIQIDDVRVRTDFIRQHIKWHAQGPWFLVTGAKFEGPSEVWGLPACRRSSLAGPQGKAVEVESFTAVWGASLSFSRALMNSVYQAPYELPYDEQMTNWGYQEVELAFRMKKAGAHIIYDPAAGVFHQDHNAETEARRGLSRQSLVRSGTENNQQYILKKHGLNEIPRW